MRQILEPSRSKFNTKFWIAKVTFHRPHAPRTWCPSVSTAHPTNKTSSVRTEINPTHPHWKQPSAKSDSRFEQPRRATRDGHRDCIPCSRINCVYARGYSTASLPFRTTTPKGEHHQARSRVTGLASIAKLPVRHRLAYSHVPHLAAKQYASPRTPERQIAPRRRGPASDRRKLPFRISVPRPPLSANSYSPVFTAHETRWPYGQPLTSSVPSAPFFPRVHNALAISLRRQRLATGSRRPFASHSDE